MVFAGADNAASAGRDRKEHDFANSGRAAELTRIYLPGWLRCWHGKKNWTMASELTGNLAESLLAGATL
jgi:hypothetical protein